ncbi:MAG: hypothetical protein HUJ68_08830, partial [Clostridia bacterium]|nr:hypothetical protein [Clostridia bacterium]
TDYETKNKISQIQQELNSIFGRVNNNISIIDKAKASLNQISDNIVQLLMEVEKNPNNDYHYIGIIKNIEFLINDFTRLNTEIEANVLSSNLNLLGFMKKNTIKATLNSLNLKLNLDLTLLTSNAEKPVEPIYSKSETVFEKTTYNSEEDNGLLLISEKDNKIFLPYSKKEVLLYLEQYPNEYKSFEDVVKKEFQAPLDYYMKHPVVARFREAYSLIRDRESKNVIDAFKYSVGLMLRHDLNPAIIAACKTQDQLEDYLSCVDKNKLEDFTHFKIEFNFLPKKMSRFANNHSF